MSLTSCVALGWLATGRILLKRLIVLPSKAHVLPGAQRWEMGMPRAFPDA